LKWHWNASRFAIALTTASGDCKDICGILKGNAAAIAYFAACKAF
jgi:hypothetical protein